MSRRRRREATINLQRYIQGIPGLIGYWSMQETAWPVAEEASAGSEVYPGANLIVGGMTAGNWTAGNNATLTNPAADVLRIARNGTNNPLASQAVLEAVKRYRLTTEARSDGNAAPRGSVRSGGALSTLPASTAWADMVVEGNTGAGNSVFLQSITGTGTEYTEWRNGQVREANPKNGDIIGATVGEDNGDGGLAYFFDGINDHVDVHSAELATDFPYSVGEIGAFASGIMDTNYRALFKLSTDASNLILIDENNAAGEMRFVHIGGGVSKIITPTGIPSNERRMMSMSYADGGTLRAYLDGLEVGTAATGLGTFASSLTVALIGAQLGPSFPWSGTIDNLFIFNRAMTDTERWGLARVGGVL